MILEDVLCDLKSQLLESGYFHVFYEYCEQIERDGITFPAQYLKAGEYKNVMDFDVNGAGYIRKRSAVSVKQNNTYQNVTSCVTDTILDVNFPLRLVAGVPRVKLNDNAFSDDFLFSELAAIITGSFSAAKTISISNSITSYDTDSISIWSNEVRGKDYQMNFKLSYVAIDFNLLITANANCMAQICGYEY